MVDQIEYLICPKCKGSNNIRIINRYGLFCIECRLCFTLNDILEILDNTPTKTNNTFFWS